MDPDYHGPRSGFPKANATRITSESGPLKDVEAGGQLLLVAVILQHMIW